MPKKPSEKDTSSVANYLSNFPGKDIVDLVTSFVSKHQSSFPINPLPDCSKPERYRLLASGKGVEEELKNGHFRRYEVSDREDQTALHSKLKEYFVYSVDKDGNWVDDKDPSVFFLQGDGTDLNLPQCGIRYGLAGPPQKLSTGKNRASIQSSTAPKHPNPLLGAYFIGDDLEYRGAFKKGTFNFEGRGKCMFKDPAEVQEGTFLDGKIIRGRSELIDRVYEGAFVQGAPEGNGTLWDTHGDCYVGQFARGVRHGEGKYFCMSEGSLYVGKFFDDQASGQGMVLLKDGGLFSGNFEKGHLNNGIYIKIKDSDKILKSFLGEHTSAEHSSHHHNDPVAHKKSVVELIDKYSHAMTAIQNVASKINTTDLDKNYAQADTTVYRGDFGPNLLFHGKGTMTTDKSIYKGDFWGGQPHGQGDFKTKDNHTYTGEWGSGTYDGQGKLTYPDGSFYVGWFEMGVYHGFGAKHFKSKQGETIKKQMGMWEQGNLVEEIKPEDEKSGSNSTGSQTNSTNNKDQQKSNNNINKFNNLEDMSTMQRLNLYQNSTAISLPLPYLLMRNFDLSGPKQISLKRSLTWLIRKLF